MTRVFVYEFTCAAPPDSADSAGVASLRAEGEAMLSAVLADFQRVPGVEAFTIRDAADEEQTFRNAASGADWSLIIAPEFRDILLTRCRWVLEEGGKLLGPSPEAVRLCGDKWELAQCWEQHGVPTPKTEPWIARVGRHCFAERTTLKPRFGAGGQHTYFLDGACFSSEVELPPGPLIKQPFIHGRPASVALLINGSRRLALRSASQILAEGTACCYYGGAAPLPSPDLERRAQGIAEQAIAVVPGLFGYVGVDVVLGDDGRDWAIEINPRLTTSYVGLRALADTNLAEAMLLLAEGGEPDLRWKRGSVEFSCNGTAAYFP